MSTIKTFKLNENAREFTAGASVGFCVRFGVKYYDRKNNQQEWTNYTASIFSNSTNQIDFYRRALVKGSVVTITAKEEKINIYTKNDGSTAASIDLLNCDVQYIEMADNGGHNAPMTPSNNARKAYDKASFKLPPNPSPAPMQTARDFEDDIPF